MAQAMLRFSLLALLSLASACLTPRSIGFGYSAEPLGKSGAEVGVATGAMYQAETLAPTNTTDAMGRPTTQQASASGWVAPHFEGNAQVGVSQSLAMNFHFSAAGVQPGLKWTVARSRAVAFCLIPQLGVGYFTQRSSTLVTGIDGRQNETVPGSTQVLLFQPGAKLLLSHRSGVYGGLSYDFVIARRTQSATIGSENNGTLQTVFTSSVSNGHQLGAALGITAEAGRVLLRPEIAVVVIPSFDTTYTQDTMSAASSGGFSFAIFPSLTIAVRNAPKTSRPDDDEEEEEEEVEVPPERLERRKEAVPE
jgi:hypothetical protein